MASDIEETEQEASGSAGHGRHLANTSAASAMKPRPALMVRLEIGQLRQDEINPSQPDEKAADDHRAVADRSDRDSRSVDCGGISRQPPAVSDPKRVL